MSEVAVASSAGARGVRARWRSVVGLSLMAVLAAAACGGSSSSGSSQTGFKVVYASPITSNSEWKRSADLLEQWAKAHGGSAQTVGPVDTVDIPKIVSDIQQAIPQHPDVIITCACQGGAFDSVLKQAKDKGIITVTLAADSAKESRNLFLGTDYKTLGKTAGQAFIQKTNGSAKILVVRQNATVQNQVEELAAFKQTIASQSGMQIVADVTDDSDAAKAQAVISQALLTHPEINAIWTLEGTSPGVIEPTLKQLNKQPGQIAVLGIDLTAATRQGIQDGYLWATMYQQFFDATPLAAKCALDIKAGKSIPDTIDTGALLVSKDNMPASLPPPGERFPDVCP